MSLIQEPSCSHLGEKWDPDDSGFSRCYDCLEAEGWEYDAEYDEGWRDRWEREPTAKEIADERADAREQDMRDRWFGD